jgi:CRP-like cAMP-binding protein
MKQMGLAQESVCKLCPHRSESVFADLAEERLDQFCRFKLVNHYKKDQRIFYEGEPNLGLFILCSGMIKLSRSSRFGRRQIVSIADPCGLLEEKDLFLSDRHTVSAEAMEDSVVCFVKKESLLDFLNLNPQVSLRVIEQLAKELERAEEKIQALTAMDAKRRLANLLLKLADRYGKEAPEGRRIEVSLTREEIAELMGTTQETVIRLLSAFRKDRLIQESDKRIVLTDEERMRKIAR